MWFYIFLILLLVFIYYYIDEIKHFMYSLHLMADQFNSSYIDDDEDNNNNDDTVNKEEEEIENKIKSK